MIQIDSFCFLCNKNFQTINPIDNEDQFKPFCLNCLGCNIAEQPSQALLNIISKLIVNINKTGISCCLNCEKMIFTIKMPLCQAHIDYFYNNQINIDEFNNNNISSEFEIECLEVIDQQIFYKLKELCDLYSQKIYLQSNHNT